MLLLNQWETAIQMVPWSCTSQRWFQQQIEADSLPSVEFSQEQSPQDKRSELWVPISKLERKKTYSKRQSKEQSWWWQAK